MNLIDSPTYQFNLNYLKAREAKKLTRFTKGEAEWPCLIFLTKFTNPLIIL
jgi:hypothetical protein